MLLVLLSFRIYFYGGIWFVILRGNIICIEGGGDDIKLVVSGDIVSGVFILG